MTPYLYVGLYSELPDSFATTSAAVESVGFRLWGLVTSGELMASLTTSTIFFLLLLVSQWRYGIYSVHGLVNNGRHVSLVLAVLQKVLHFFRTEMCLFLYGGSW